MSQQPPDGGRGYPPPGGDDQRPFPESGPGHGSSGSQQVPSGQGEQYGQSPYGQAPSPGQGEPYRPSGAYGQSPYGQSGPGYGYGEPPAQRRNGLGVAALVLGVLALLSVLTVFTFPVGIVLAIAAIVCGVLGRGRAKRREATNGGAALAGLVLGVVSLLIGIVLAAVVGLAASLFGDEISGLSECLAQAGNDQAAIEQCNLEFQDSVQQQSS